MKRIEYPRMLYAPGCESHKTVANEQEEQAARQQGFGTWHEAMAVTSVPEPVIHPAPSAEVATGPTDEQWNDVQKLLAYGRSIGMKLGVKYKLETLRDKVREHQQGQA